MLKAMVGRGRIRKRGLYCDRRTRTGNKSASDVGGERKIDVFSGQLRIRMIDCTKDKERNGIK